MEKIVEVRSPKTMAFILMLGAFVGLFGETALNMALSDVMEDFSVTAGIAQWLTTGYLLTLAILVPVSALLIRWFTTKQLVTVAFLFSLAGSILAALAPSFAVLQAGRIIQAIGTGIVLPVMLNVVLLIFPIARRGAVMGIVGLVITTAPAVGPTLSGIIISTLGWHYIFWISALFYLLLLMFGLSKMSNVSEITKPKIDIMSIILSTIGFGGLIYALATMAEKPFTEAIVWLPLLIGVTALILFCMRQMKMEQPMINLRVFKYSMFTVGTLIMFLSILIILSASILLPIYLKGALLYSAAMAGVLLLPGNAVNLVMSPIVGSLFEKIGARRFVITGFIFVMGGLVLFLTSLTAEGPVWPIVIAFMILFFGLTMTTMPAQTNALNQLPRELYADGSAAMNTLNQVAGAMGTAIAITLFTGGQESHFLDYPSASMPEVLAAGTKHAFYFIMIISVIGFIASLFIKKHKKA